MINVQELQPIVEEAASAILLLYRQKGDVVRKEDGSPLTAADRRSHEILTAGLNKVAPEIPVLSEEGRSMDYNIRKSWASYFLIDPVDGTKGFLEENDEFTVNIAMIREERPVLGIIHHPVSGVTYFASEGQGAYRRDSKETIRLPLAHTREESLRVLLSRNDFSTVLDDILARLGKPRIDKMHSSLKFCLLAEGTADLYLRMLPCMEWDTAAGSIILEEAGGKILQPGGDPLLYNRPNLKNPPFFAFSRFFPDTIKDWRQVLKS